MMNIIKTFEQFVSEINENDFGVKCITALDIKKPIEQKVAPQKIKQVQATHTKDKEDREEDVKDQNNNSNIRQNI